MCTGADAPLQRTRRLAAHGWHGEAAAGGGGAARGLPAAGALRVVGTMRAAAGEVYCAFAVVIPRQTPLRLCVVDLWPLADASLTPTLRQTTMPKKNSFKHQPQHRMQQCNHRTAHRFQPRTVRFTSAPRPPPLRAARRTAAPRPANDALPLTFTTAIRFQTRTHRPAAGAAQHALQLGSASLRACRARL
jgi:hypothetical protein